ncbi:hypothetical protein BC567DRAFT_62307 [Phyllosticta citribraziliensis]
MFVQHLGCRRCKASRSTRGLFSLPMWRCSTARCEARSHFYLRVTAVITDQGLLIPLGYNHDFNVLPHAGLTASTYCVYPLDRISRTCRAGPRPPCRSLAQMQRNTCRPTGAGPKDELLWTRALRHCTPSPWQVERVEDLFRSDIDHLVMHSATRKRSPSSSDQTKPNAHESSKAHACSFFCASPVSPHCAFAGASPLFCQWSKSRSVSPFSLLFFLLIPFSAFPNAVSVRCLLPGAVVSYICGAGRP